LGIDIGQRNGMLYNLDVGEESINCIRSTLQPFDFLPIPDYNYGYYWTSNDYEYYNTLYRYYYFSGGELDYKAFNSRSNSERYSVRLVKNVE
jgi:hypothetical protein